MPNIDSAHALHGRTGKWHALSLHAVLSILLITVVLVVGGLLTALNYERGRDIANSASAVLFGHIEREMALQLNNLYTPISQLVDLTASQPLLSDKTLQARLLRLPALFEAMRHSPALSAIYVGYANGNFFQLRRLNPSAPAVGGLVVPIGAAYMIQSIARVDERHDEAAFIFLRADMQPMQTVRRDKYTFDPRTRDWYRQAIRQSGQIQTRPYAFFSNGEPGITVARRGSEGNSVVGADISLADLSAMLARQSISPSAELVLTDDTSAVMAYQKPAMMIRPPDAQGRMHMTMLPELGGAQFAALTEKIRTKSMNRPFDTVVNGRTWSGRVVPVQLGAVPLYLAISVPEDELLGDARQMLRNGLMVTLALLLAAIPLAAVIAWRLGLPLRLLAREAKALQDFDFSTPLQSRSRIREIQQLMISVNETRLTLQRFTDISIALAAEQNFDKLLERIVTETMSIARADAGILYLLDDDRKLARPVLTKWQGLTEYSAPATLDIDAIGNADNPLCRTLIEGSTQIREMTAATMHEAAWLGDGSTCLPAVRHTLATIPLKNRRDERIGAILWISPVRDQGVQTHLQTHLFAFLEALSGAAAISIENKQLIKTQVDLLEAMIQVIAGAIDAKSPYTGGHCQRVPELTKMLAQAACEAEQGPFKDFSLSEDQWQEVHVASWLHDCGKMTTPEFVVDKATKLETIYDRLHEIRMRFEVIKRDRQIAALMALLAGGNKAVVDAALAQELAQLDDEFAFIASCNVGSETMAPENMERVREIAQRTWQRTLDDRLGISWEERERKNRLPAPALPVEETLLEDRVDHRIARREQDRLAEDNPWGFKVQTPELLYDRGEIYNLCIKSGTLTPEERYKINEHIVQTIIMLNRLPFPRHLANVPEIAGGHHERMNGKGYPKQLTREEMSPVARMMAVADIFEALTAADRPYKKGKKLSEAIAIMVRMKDTGHIDPDIFELFFNSGIYLKYARKYMAEELIDTAVA